MRAQKWGRGYLTLPKERKLYKSSTRIKLKKIQKRGSKKALPHFKIPIAHNHTHTHTNTHTHTHTYTYTHTHTHTTQGRNKGRRQVGANYFQGDTASRGGAQKGR